LLAYSELSHGSRQPNNKCNIKISTGGELAESLTTYFLRNIQNCDVNNTKYAITVYPNIVHTKDEDGNTAFELIQQYIKNEDPKYVHYNYLNSTFQTNQAGLKIIQMLADAGADMTPNINSLLQNFDNGYKFPTPLADDLLKFKRQIKIQEIKNYQTKVNEFDQKYKRPKPTSAKAW
jgi:hypothetical protein